MSLIMKGERWSPEEIVRAEMAAWGRNDVDEVMSHFADDLTLYVGPYPPISGRDAIRKTMEAYFGRGKCIDLKILYLAVDGDVVLMERDDHWIVNGEERHWAVMAPTRYRINRSLPGVSTSPQAIPLSGLHKR